MQKKYKIGDIVRVRSNLKGNTRYYYDGSDNEYLFFNIAMQKFCGHAYKIIDKVSSFYPGYVNYRLALGDETCEWVFSDIMLEPETVITSYISPRNFSIAEAKYNFPHNGFE